MWAAVSGVPMSGMPFGPVSCGCGRVASQRNGCDEGGSMRAPAARAGIRETGAETRRRSRCVAQRRDRGYGARRQVRAGGGEEIPREESQGSETEN